MIKKLSSLKFIRNFIDFQSDVEFKKKNIIYAPNGTGKTNLSRLLLSLKNVESINHFKSQEAENNVNLQFSVECSDDNLDQTNYQAKKEPLSKLLVFNSDYVEETIKSENFSNQDVSGKIEISVGKESNEIETLEKEAKAKSDLRKKGHDDLKKNFKSFQTTKEKIKDFTRKDQSIWSEFKLEKLIADDFKISIPKNLASFNDCQENLKKLKKIDESSQLTTANPIKIDSESINFKDLITDLKEPKQFEIADIQTQQTLGQITKEWLETKDIRTGVEASKKADKCLLCQRELDENVNQLFENYELYFKNAESKFKDKLKPIRSQINKQLEEIYKINNDLESNTNSNCTILNIGKTWSKIDTSNLIRNLEDLVSSIDKKIADTNQNALLEFSEISETIISKELENLNSSLKSNNELVDEINKKLIDSGKRKTELRIEVGKKWLYDFYIQEKSKVESIDSLNGELSQLIERLGKEKEKLPASDVLSNLIKVANQFLHKDLCLTKYSFGESSGKIVIKLNNKNISSETKQKISEGEKTMLALCYFMASSIRELKNIEDFKEAIFVIDDPVNSTSYNYLFGIGFLLKSFDEDIAKMVWPNDNFQNGQNVQKIILTHNTPLFNVLKSQVFKESGKKNEEGVYIPKHGYFLMSNSEFKEIKKEHLKSEFETSLLAIKKAYNSDLDDLVIGNDLRRVLETIKHFYGMKGQFDAAWLNTVFKNFDIVDHRTFFGVINYYSHGNPEAHEDPLHPTNFRPFLNQFNELIENSNFKDLWNKLDE